jgi:TrmH family RNA methyltransferase
MASDEIIRSRANPLLKRAAGVLEGLEPGTIALEGDRLVDDAIAAGRTFEAVLVAENREARIGELLARGAPVRRVDTELLGRVSKLKTSPGILALAATPPPLDLARIPLDERSILLVAAGVADPGNLGALARSAEAFGVTALLVARGGASPWSEKALRGSMGSLLRLSVGYDRDADEIATALESRRVRNVRAATRGGKDARSFDWKGPIAIWVGSETGEMPARAETFEPVTIPMAGAVESLNVAVAASLLLFASRGDQKTASVQHGKAHPGGGIRPERRDGRRG